MPTSSRAAPTPPGAHSRTFCSMGPSSMTTWAAPASWRRERADSRREVATTVIPMRAPRRTAISPTEEVAPRTRIVSPLLARIAETIEPYAVSVISGRAPRTAQSRSESKGITIPSGTSAYSA